MLLTSDRHIDSPYSDWDMQKRHLELARERNAFIIDNGDAFDIMQGRYDKRRNKKELVNEFKTENYPVSVLHSAAERLRPYADLFAVFGMGNHEKGVLKHTEFNVTQLLLGDLGILGAYQGVAGWVLLKFKTVGAEGATWSRSTLMSLYRHHGAGGGAPVTKGTIKTARRTAYINADIIVSGHIHNSWIMETTKVELDRVGNERLRSQWHIQVASYKDAFGKDSWEDDMEMEPKPKGAWWVKFYEKDRDHTIGFDIIKAD